MRIKHKLSLIIITFIIFINPVHAKSYISLDCPSSSSNGTTINCNVITNSDVELSAVKTQLKVSSNLELLSFTTDSKWQGNGDFGNIDLYTSPNQSGVIKLGVATIKILNNKSKTGTISLEDTKFYLDDFSEINGNNTSFNIKILSINNNLTSITLNKGNLTPNFNKDILKYQTIIDDDNITISAKAEDITATINGTGLHTLKEGENHFNITVTSEAGTKKIYQVNITRPIKKKEENSKKDDNTEIKEENKKPTKKEESTNEKTDTSNKENTLKQEENQVIKLKDLTVEGYKLSFNGNQNNYSLDLLNDESTLNIKAIPSSNNIKVTISGNENLKEGANEIIITLEDNSGNKNTYTIIASKKSNICLIKNINIEGYPFDFNCNKYEYNIKIKDEENLNIEVIPINKNSAINIYNNDNLENNSIINIIINDGDNTQKYLINIIKDENTTNIINNNKTLIITSITILGLLYLIGRFIIKKKLFIKIKK